MGLAPIRLGEHDQARGQRPRGAGCFLSPTFFREEIFGVGTSLGASGFIVFLLAEDEKTCVAGRK